MSEVEDVVPVPLQEVEREAYKLCVQENERLVLRSWVLPKLPGDRAGLTDAYGTALEDKECLEVPLRGGKWVGEWEAGEWQYAFDFNLSRFHDKKTLRDFVRTRRWVRLCEAPSTGDFIPPSDPDKLPTDCALCGKEFGPLTREHHCRTCHLSVCGSCSGQSISTPGYSTEQRCCNECATANGIKISGWYVGKALQRRVKTIRGTIHTDMHNPTKEVVYRNQEAEEKKCGEVKARLYECRDVSGWAGEMGTPNPHVEMYLNGSYVKTKGKPQTRSPKWGEAEGSFKLPCIDPTSSLFFCVYDVSSLGQNRPLGRGAIPLTLLKKAEATEMWVDLLPCGEPEATGYDAEQPKPFRGCSSVTEVLGMHDPKRPLGMVHLSIQYTPNEPPIAGLVPRAYVTSEVYRNPIDPGNEVFRLKDSAARLSAEVGPPTLLRFLWENGVYAAGMVPIWWGLSWGLALYQVPYIVMVVVISNGLLLSKVKGPRDVILYEENNPYKTPTLWKKLGNMSRALKFTTALHNPVAKAATAASRSSSLFSYDDPVISGIATLALVVASFAASIVIYILSLFPLRLYIALIGTAVIILPSEIVTKSKKEKDEEKDEKIDEERKPLPPYVTACVNFFNRIPDDLEQMHRQICAGQLRANPVEAKE